MDKSEGTNFLSKTFSSIGDTVAKWYQSSQKKVSIVSLKRARSEKLNMLGSKVFNMIASGTKIEAYALKEEYDAILRIDAQLEEAGRELELMKQVQSEEKNTVTPQESAPAPKRRTGGRKKATSAESTETSAKTEKSTKKTGRKPAAKKTSVAKKPRAARKPAADIEAPAEASEPQEN